jgi:hypothetical protein
VVEQQHCVCPTGTADCDGKQENGCATDINLTSWLSTRTTALTLERQNDVTSWLRSSRSDDHPFRVRTDVYLP